MYSGGLLVLLGRVRRSLGKSVSEAEECAPERVLQDLVLKEVRHLVDKIEDLKLQVGIAREDKQDAERKIRAIIEVLGPKQD